jgi:hypothetical protein
VDLSKDGDRRPPGLEGRRDELSKGVEKKRFVGMELNLMRRAGFSAELSAASASVIFEQNAGDQGTTLTVMLTRRRC